MGSLLDFIHCVCECEYMCVCISTCVYVYSRGNGMDMFSDSYETYFCI